jgi:uncharacterized membrane protein YgcG
MELTDLLEDFNYYYLILPVVALLISFGFVQSLARKMKSQPEDQARNYVLPGSFAIQRSTDTYLYQTTTKTRRSSNNNSSGGGSRSHGGKSSRSSSRSRSHGGKRGRR